MLSRRRDIVRGALAPASAGFTGLDDLRAAKSGKSGKSDKSDRLFVLECAGEEHEARAIAALLRDALESRSSFLGDSGAVSSSASVSPSVSPFSPAPSALRAALVTPSRTLARRVAGELRRWKLDIDDSGGVPLAETSAGVFLRLTLDATEAGWPPVLLLSVLKHPFVCLGRRRSELRVLVARLERRFLRRADSGADLRSIARQVHADGDEALISLISDLRSAQSGLAVILERGGGGAAGAMEAHMDLLRALCAGGDDNDDGDVSVNVNDDNDGAAVIVPVNGDDNVNDDNDGAAVMVNVNGDDNNDDKNGGGVVVNVNDDNDGAAVIVPVDDDNEGAVVVNETPHFLRGNIGSLIRQTLDDLQNTLAQKWARDLAPAWYAAALRARLREASWRAPWSDSRLAILGPMEARLISADLFILGGLNEGAWPSRPALGPWLGRRMRQDLSLHSPERRIGQAAHDFTQSALAGNRVVLTWSLRQGEEPAVPSRWILRLRAFAAALGDSDNDGDNDGAVLCDLKDVLGAESPLWRHSPPPESTETVTTDKDDDKKGEGIRLKADDIPNTLSVSAIECLRRNPYEFFARQILRLRERDPLEQELGASVWGTYLHFLASEMSQDDAVLAALARGADDDALALAVSLAEKHAADWPGLRENLLLRAPIWRRIARWLLARESLARRADAEVQSEIDLYRVLADGTTLRGRADRLERYRAAGAGTDADKMRVIDHKSGGLPAKSAVVSGDAPQLPLLAALVMGQENPPSEIEAEYWSLSGWTGRSSNIREAFGGSADTTLAELQEKEWRRLEDELRALAAGETALDWREKNPGRGNWGAYDAAWRHLARRWEQG